MKIIPTPEYTNLHTLKNKVVLIINHRHEPLKKFKYCVVKFILDEKYMNDLVHPIIRTDVKEEIKIWLDLSGYELFDKIIFGNYQKFTDKINIMYEGFELKEYNN